MKVGDEIEAKIIGFENNKITLSIKALQEPPVVEASEEAAEGASEKSGSSRAASFADRAGRADANRGPKKGGKPRRENSDEPHELITNTSSGATFADIFKDFDMDKFGGEEESK